MTSFVRCLEQNSVAFSSNLKFGKLLLALLNKYPKQASVKNGESVLESSMLFFRKIPLLLFRTTKVQIAGAN